MPWELPADEDRCYAAVASRDDRFDGWFIIGVRTTGIYCRPSCPTPVRPRRRNVSYFPTAGAAQRAGFRACKRCRPDATPGSPEWDLRADLVGRAMRLISDGLVERVGVAGLAAELAVSERHLHRVLVEELGAGPLAIARARRATTARTLIETTALPFAQIAFAAGFSSIRQFNDTIRDVFATTPSKLRSSGVGPTSGEGAITVRLPFRTPLDARHLFGWHRTHGVPGLTWEEPADGLLVLRRSLRLPHGAGSVRLEAMPDHVGCELALEDIADLGTAVERCRRMLDLDADPVVIAEALAPDRRLRPVLERRPGLRVPGAVDGFEAAVVAILGQQVDVRAARTLAGRLVERLGRPLPGSNGRYLFPGPDELAEADLDGLGVPITRAGAIRSLAAACVSGLRVDRGVDRVELRRQLLDLPGIGPWTADIIAMRAAGDPDVLPVGDLVIRRGAAAIGLPDDPAALVELSSPWSPWRSYVAHHLWATATSTRSNP
jgi:AraC family transcriptional regulator, regulatory protein of adaptative response / DNA-3-methyladenine glycosylase II